MKRQKVISIRENIYKKAKQIAEKENSSMTSLVEQAIGNYINRLSSGDTDE